MMKMMAMMTVLEKPFKNEFNKNPSLTLNDPEKFPLLTGLKNTLLAPSSGQHSLSKNAAISKATTALISFKNTDCKTQIPKSTFFKFKYHIIITFHSFTISDYFLRV